MPASLAVCRAVSDPQGTVQKIGRTGPFRFISANLLRRILLANLAGLAIMVGGILILSSYNVWLVEAKQESLRTQGINSSLASTEDLLLVRGTIRRRRMVRSLRV